MAEKVKWIRVSFYELELKDYMSLMRYVKKITNHLKCRFFFLFEEDPEFMLQLDYRDIEKVKTYVSKKPFRKIDIKFIDNPEEKNPYALRYYCLGAEYALSNVLDQPE